MVKNFPVCIPQLSHCILEFNPVPHIPIKTLFIDNAHASSFNLLAVYCCDSGDAFSVSFGVCLLLPLQHARPSPCVRELSLLWLLLKDQAVKDKALQSMASMSSAQIVSATAIHNKLGLPGIPRPAFPGAGVRALSSPRYWSILSSFTHGSHEANHADARAKSHYTPQLCITAAIR